MTREQLEALEDVVKAAWDRNEKLLIIRMIRLKYVMEHREPKPTPLVGQER